MTGFLLVILYFALAALAAWIIMRPNRFVVTRWRIVDAPPQEVFRHIDELRNWQAWSPWAKLDPAATNTYEGPAAGAGAVFAWSGDKKVGAGRMTIIDSRPYRERRHQARDEQAFRGVERRVVPAVARGERAHEGHMDHVPAPARWSRKR